MILGPVSEDAKAVIVDEHNRLRALTAKGELPGFPKASNIAALEWDEDLAKSAQDVAEQLKAKAPVERNESVGENIFRATGPKAKDVDWLKAINFWFDQHRGFRGTVENYVEQSPDVSTFSQVVWATTTHVGCGAVTFKDGMTNAAIAVCHYYPPGNNIGEAVYGEGDSCGACSSGCSANFPTLCAPTRTVAGG
eukprot:TRINITY_DN6627_c0_g2_i4.p1 TRINITY_DN6627_c0_g2~~TRINITY_DN6627_c0_g2_i4.p1  ORF type:complete len:194 (+),score=30.33 TRINITY_DN6627_c0_g2_i4:98-679(+)